MVCRGTATSPLSLPWAAGESQLRCLEHLLPLLLHWPGYLKGCSSQMFSLLSHNFLNLITVVPPASLFACCGQWQVYFGALPNLEAAPSIFLENANLYTTFPTAKTFPHKLNAKIHSYLKAVVWFFLIWLLILLKNYKMQCLV